MRNLIALVVAASVCWHTVAGCCAHHDHAASPAGESGMHDLAGLGGDCDHVLHPVSLSQEAHPASGRCAAWQTGLDCWEGRCLNHAGCGLGYCAFAVPKSVSLPDREDDDGKAAFLNGAALVSRNASPPFASLWTTAEGNACGGAALRRHLMLSVMRL